MPGRPNGSVVTLTYDLDGEGWPDPDRDDVVVTFHKGTEDISTIYLVLSVRQVRSQVHPRRFSLRCLKMGKEVPAEIGTVFPLFWYPRKRRPRLR